MSTVDELAIESLPGPWRSVEFAELIAQALAKHAAASHGPEETLRSVLPLLQEFQSKLERSPDKGYLQKLQPPAKRLAQFVSQRLQTVKDDVLRLELELRLAEFEWALNGASRQTLQRAAPSS